MTSNEELQGPDLTNGVSRDQLEEGKPIVGHAHGEPVMLVKSDGEVFATGASCTHYGGPLGDGVVSGKRVRCPWHHATFDLTTGDATAPAHDPIGCFEVIEENGKVAVGERRTRRDPKPKLQPGRVVIIGAGAAGSSCAETLRRRGYEGKLTIVAGDAAFPVDRPNLSKDYLAGDAPQEWLPVHDDAFFDEHDIDFVQKFATRIDRDARQVQLDDGSSLGFDALVIATGAAPRTLDVPGADGSGVHQLRTLEDANAIIADAEGAERAAIVGGSFIGLEAAASLRSRGLEVTVIDPQATPLQHVLGPELGRAVQSIHESHGVTFELGHQAKAIDANGVELRSGKRIDADLVVVGIGVEPRTELAEEAGLECFDGIIVDEYLQADDGIFAVGDVARFPYRDDSARIEHWALASRQGQIAARNILGDEVSFDEVPFFWSRHFDNTVSYVGHADSWDEVDVEGSLLERDATVAYRRNGEIRAVATLGRPEVSMMAEIAMEQGDQNRLEELVSAR